MVPVISPLNRPSRKRLALRSQRSSLILAALLASWLVASIGCRSLKSRPVVAPAQAFSLIVSVHDQDGRSPLEVRPGDLDILMDGRPLPIRSVHPAGPFSLLLLLDTSASMAGAVATAELREGLIAVVSQLRPAENLRVAAFNSDVEMGPDFGSPLQTILGFLNTLRYHNATHLYDVLATGLAALERAVGRPVLLVVSDGSDTDSRLTGDDVLIRARRSSIQVGAVLPPNKTPGLNRRPPDKALLHVIEETGGMYVQPRGSVNLASALVAVVRDLQEQYLVEVEVAAFDGKVHKFTVRGTLPRWTFRAARSGIVQAVDF